LKCMLRRNKMRLKMETYKSKRYDDYDFRLEQKQKELKKKQIAQKRKEKEIENGHYYH